MTFKTAITVALIAACVLVPCLGFGQLAMLIRPLISGLSQTFVKTAASAGTLTRVGQMGAAGLRTMGRLAQKTMPVARKVGMTAAGTGAAYGVWTGADAIKHAVDDDEIDTNIWGPAVETEETNGSLKQKYRRPPQDILADHPLMQPPGSGPTLEMPMVLSLDREDDVRPLDRTNPTYGKGVNIVSNFQGQIEMHHLGQLLLGLEQGVLTIDYPTDALLRATGRALALANAVLELTGHTRHLKHKNGELPDFDLYQRRSAVATIQRTKARRNRLHATGTALTYLIQGVDRPGRSRRWVQEMNLGLGGYQELSEAARARGDRTDDPPSGMIHVHLHPGIPALDEAIRVLRNGHNGTISLVEARDGLWSEQLEIFGLALEDLARINEAHTGVLRAGLSGGRMSTDFISWEDLRRGFGELFQEAKEYRLIPLVERPAQLLQAPLRVRRHEDRLTMWLEIPLIPEGEAPYDIMKASPALLRTPNGHLLQLKTSSTLLRRSDELIAIPDEDLKNACHQYNGLMACARSLTYKKRTSCEAEMLGEQLERGDGQCQSGLAILDPFQEHASQVGIESFDWYAPYPTKVTVTCADGRQETPTLQGLCRVELERGCGVDTGSFRLDRAESGVRIPEKVMWTVPPVRVASVLGKVKLPEPEKLEGIRELLRDMREEDGSPALGRFLQRLARRAAAEAEREDISSSNRTVWLVVLTTCIFIDLVLKPCLLRVMERIRTRWRARRDNNDDEPEPDKSLVRAHKPKRPKSEDQGPRHKNETFTLEPPAKGS